MAGGQIVPAVDLGGTFAKGALVATDGRLLWRERISTEASAGYEDVNQRVANLLKRLMERAKAEHGWEKGPLGLAVPGLVNDVTGTAVFSANLGWRNLPLAKQLSQQLDAQVILSHDVTAGGVAEARLGAGRGASTVLVVPIGTGIAGALVMDGKPYRGAHFAAMELGHLPTAVSEDPCGCGGVGCLERVASAAAVARRYADLAGVDGKDIDAKYVQELAEQGNNQARLVWDQARFALAEALATAALLADPDRIVIGGGLSYAGHGLIGPIQERVNQRVKLHQPPEVVLAQLGSWAGVIGAALLASDSMADAVPSVDRL